MPKYYDLSIFSDEYTPQYPGDLPPIFESAAKLEVNGWNEHRLTMNTHFGTHIDYPFHMFADGKRSSDYPIDSLIGRGIVLDVRGQLEINLDISQVSEGDIVLFWTDHMRKAGQDAFYNEPPSVTPVLAERLVMKKVKMVGIDSYSLDFAPFPSHQILLGNDILIIENLDGLREIYQDKVRIFALPLKVNQLDGAPCRVIAEVWSGGEGGSGV